MSATKEFWKVTNIVEHISNIDFLYRIPIHILARTILLRKNDGSVRTMYDRTSLCCQKILPGHHSVERFRPHVIRNWQWRKSKWHLAKWRRRIWAVVEETRREIRPLDHSVKLQSCGCGDWVYEIRGRAYEENPIIKLHFYRESCCMLSRSMIIRDNSTHNRDE